MKWYDVMEFLKFPVIIEMIEVKDKEALFKDFDAIFHYITKNDLEDYGQYENKDMLLKQVLETMKDIKLSKYKPIYVTLMHSMPQFKRLKENKDKFKKSPFIKSGIVEFDRLISDFEGMGIFKV